ncbi:hypothetical protein E2C01_038068 [Portunus trituberculatus]|uniref:Uncharacterized protein n=1 Tax=Portunus trituberculatus TaxID=210409 RepID=A0A5B7FGA7_PORTR|nr:hypothetical protein [Portunus trituberculatus]
MVAMAELRTQMSVHLFAQLCPAYEYVWQIPIGAGRVSPQQSHEAGEWRELATSAPARTKVGKLGGRMGVVGPTEESNAVAPAVQR